MDTSKDNEKKDVKAEAQNDVQKDITNAAQELLYESQDVILQTRKAAASTYASPLLVLWGLLWFIAYLASYLYINYAFRIFMFMALAGGVGTALLFKMLKPESSMKDPTEDTSDELDEGTPCSRMGLRIAALWFFLFIYVIIWLFLFEPFSGLQCNALVGTAVMFAYIVMGLWFESYFIVGLGLLVTAVSLISFYFLPVYYSLCLAFVGVGAIFGTGLYIKLRWENKMARIDTLIHQPVRLKIMSTLVGLGKNEHVHFTHLRKLLKLTDGNLGSHLTRLEDADYVKIEKTFVDSKPQTLVSATEKGRDAFSEHIAALKEIIDGSK